MKPKHRTPWVNVSMEVCFEETQMELVRRGKVRRAARTVDVVTPVFRLPDGTEFTGRRASSALRSKILNSAWFGKKPRP